MTETIAEEKRTSTPKCLVDFFAEAERLSQRVRALEPQAIIAHDVAATFPDLKPTVRVVDWGLFNGVFIALQLRVAKFDEILPAMRMLAALGYRTDKTKPYEDYHEIDRRTYNLGEAPHPLRVMAFLRHESPVCRRVQVGVREEPVYEFVCDEPAVAEVQS